MQVDLVPLVTGPRRARRGPLVMAVAVVIAVVAVVGIRLAATLARDLDHAVGADDERRFVPSVLPDGMVLRSAHEPGAQPVPVVHLLYLAERDRSGAFVGRRALVETVVAPDEVVPTESPGAPVALGDRAGWYRERTADGDVSAVHFLEAGALVTVTSPMLDEGELAAIATAVRVDHVRARLTGEVAGLVVVAEAGTATPFLAGDPATRSLGYADDAGRSVVVAAVPDDGSRLVALVWWGGRRTTLAGRDAVVLRGGEPDRPVQIALWADGAMVIGVSGDLDDTSLEAIAAGITEVDASTWAATVAGAPDAARTGGSSERAGR